MRILGVDPGYAILGWGVVDYRGSRHRLAGYGVIETRKDEAQPQRLKQVYSGLAQIIEQYRPDVCAVEELFFNSNQKTAIKVGEARGAAIVACANAGLGVYEYTPLQIKQALTGYGRAEKHQVQEMVRQILGLERAPRPDDAADAVAAAICHANSSGYIERVAVAGGGR
ncbi:MAG: crossover junction endodeoxyribonuclease RuvC [Clostridiales bacterium]|nr:crossover junction endodeoxyribonuclease RuvC [Clostridiales bacterium]